jgi:hypothetical protein
MKWTMILSGSAMLAAGVAVDEPKPPRPALEMSRAVVCKKVVGYENYVELPDASLTSVDKLNVYFRPLNFRVDPVEKPRTGSRFKAKFNEDMRIRRKGEKAVLQKKDGLGEYEPTFDKRDQTIYIVNNIGLKGLEPGDYEIDVVLHDLLEKDVTATQTVAFTIVPLPKVDPAPKEQGTDEPESPPVPKSKTKSKSKSKAAKKPAKTP